MKRILAILLTFLMLLAMAAPAYAVTPSFKAPSISIPDISGSVKIEIPQSTWDKWFAEHPIKFNFTLQKVL